MYRSPNPRGYGLAFSAVLCLLALIIFLAPLYFFYKGWTQYDDSSFIDYQLKILTPGETLWLKLLFALPLAAAIVSLLFLIPKVHSDKKLIPFYASCLVIMFLCPLSYCGLWSVYTSTHTSGDFYQKEYSLYALFFIILLLIPVGIMTYAILWKKPARNSERLHFTVQDVKDWPAFFAALQNEQSKLNHLRLRILQLLPQSLGFQILNATTPADFDQISKADIIMALNQLLRTRSLHLAFDDNVVGSETSQLLSQVERDVCDEDVEQLNMSLITEFFQNEISRHEIPLSKPRQIVRWLTRTWQRYIASLNFGVEAAHFWVLVFFFTVFLGITYLFGFAFAFHDKFTVKDTGSAALFMERTAQYVAQGAGGSVNPQASGLGQPHLSFVFYFAPKSAVPQYKYGQFDSAGYELSKDLKRRNEDWRSRKNVEHFDEAAKAIVSISQTDTPLRIELRGSADDGVLGERLTYSSNYTLSEARAQNIKFVLSEKLRSADNREHRIEWLTLPLSSEAELSSPLAEDQGVEKEKAVKDFKRKVEQWSRLPIRERRARMERENQEDKQRWTTKLLQDGRLSADDRDLIEKKIKTVFDLSAEFNITVEQRDALLVKVEEWAQLLSLVNEERSPEKKEQLVKDLAQKRKELEEAIEAVEYVDVEAAKRTVKATLVPMQNNNQFMPLSLVDYMYFTVYTITTTGYGDIIPTTVYAKFLCSLANILEVFFLVVFFNSLLSVRR